MKDFHVIVSFDAELLDHFGVSDWNAYIRRLRALELDRCGWSGGEAPPPFTARFEFEGLDRAHYHLDGIDLGGCDLIGSNFTGASLRNAILGSCTDACFRDADLSGADFSWADVTGCDFTGAKGLEGAKWVDAYYLPIKPPVGLPLEIFDQIHPDWGAARVGRGVGTQSDELEGFEDDLSDDEEEEEEEDDGRIYPVFKNSYYEAHPTSHTASPVPVSAFIYTVPIEEKASKSHEEWVAKYGASEEAPPELVARISSVPMLILDSNS